MIVSLLELAIGFYPELPKGMRFDFGINLLNVRTGLFWRSLFLIERESGEWRLEILFIEII